MSTPPRRLSVTLLGCALVFMSVSLIGCKKIAQQVAVEVATGIIVDEIKKPNAEASGKAGDLPVVAPYVPPPPPAAQAPRPLHDQRVNIKWNSSVNPLTTFTCNGSNWIWHSGSTIQVFAGVENQARYYYDPSGQLFLCFDIPGMVSSFFYESR